MMAFKAESVRDPVPVDTSRTTEIPPVAGVRFMIWGGEIASMTDQLSAKRGVSPEEMMRVIVRQEWEKEFSDGS
jgi:hypothetical protein